MGGVPHIPDGTLEYVCVRPWLKAMVITTTRLLLSLNINTQQMKVAVIVGNIVKMETKATRVVDGHILKKVRMVLY